MFCRSKGTGRKVGKARGSGLVAVDPKWGGEGSADSSYKAFTETTTGVRRQAENLTQAQDPGNVTGMFPLL